MLNIYNKLSKHIIENQDKFYRLSYTYVRNKDDALDIVQNAVVKALEKYKSIKNEEAINCWFYKILVNENLLFLRSKKRDIKNEVSIEEMPYFEKFNDDIDIFDQIKFLPTDTQTIIILHYFEDLTLAQVSEITNCNLNTVKSRLYSGLKKLKIKLEEEKL
ncbi:RNA polymerase sigma factor [[Clostridium] colinum]|uniref:RNA polymerase sigma factor n=1 Tax=[Clostridium] colinum TaxID=36835 RepID=UPI002023D3C5|nr:RNA polymerase sigma factor [[Clostridium] colinum]